jgi:hypothetical protein
MSHQCLADAFAETEAKYKAKVIEDTWGHLAPIKNRIYKGRIVYTAGCFGHDHLNPTALFCTFKGLVSSPWFYNAIQEFMSSQRPEEGIVYEFIGTFRNYEFNGKIKKVFDSNKE